MSDIFNKPGIVFDLPNEIYHAGAELSASGLKLLQKTPAHYWARNLDPDRKENEPSSAMAFGTAVHCAILEPEKFSSRFALVPQGTDKRTKDGKQFYEKLEHAGFTPIKNDDWEALIIIRERAKNNPFLRTIFTKNHATEASIYFERGGVKCRIRPDLMAAPCDVFPNGIICDVKTASDASAEGFAKAAWDYGYHLQNEFYADGYQQTFGTEKPPVFMFYVIENTAPFMDAVYILDADVLQYSKVKNDQLIELFRTCSASNIWPGYDKKAQVLKMPGWAQSVINNELAGV